MRKVYNLYYILLWPILKFRYRIRCVGLEKIPDGAALVCANHSCLADPLITAIAFTRRHFLHFMAKAELSKLPLMRLIFEKGGAFFVNRGTADVKAIKTMIKYLQEDEKVMLFPEGTRVSEDDAVAAKNGAVKIAVKTGKPILPVYIPRKKPWFKKTNIVVGEPYFLTGPESRDGANEYYRNASDELMRKISALREMAK